MRFLYTVDEIFKCDHSNKSYKAALSGDAVYHALLDVFYF